MRKKINKIAAVFIVAIFALSGLSMAYAAWTDTITIDGTVTTGSLCWEFTDCRLLDHYPPINYGGDFPTLTPDYGCNPGFTPNDQGSRFWEVDKNVGWAEQSLKDLDLDGFRETLEVVLYNVYPCYFNELGWYVRNYGTVPIKIDHVVINGIDVYYQNFYQQLDISGNGIPDFEIQYGDNFGVQIEPGEYAIEEFSFWMHILQDEDPAFQSGCFTFTIEIVCIQWNEYTGSPP